MQSDDPFRESHLDSAEYRDRLRKKLNCLIAVLEVAQAKVRRSLEEPEPDRERLSRIQVNLKSTLEVCKRARRALNRREPLGEKTVRRLASGRRTRRLPKGARHEMTSPKERAHFESMGKIKPNEILGCDFERLSRLLQD